MSQFLTVHEDAITLEQHRQLTRNRNRPLTDDWDITRITPEDTSDLTVIDTTKGKQ